MDSNDLNSMNEETEDNELLSARSEINEVDEKMAELFIKRMDAVYRIAEYKKHRGLPVVDERRDKEVIARNLNFIKEPKLQPFYAEFMYNNINVSKKYQKGIVEGMKVAYCGIKGAFAYIAAKRIFPTADLVSYPDFQSAYDSVERGETECAVLPLENSYAGEVGSVTDMMFAGSLYVNALYTYEINQCLMGTQDATKEDIKSVYSHPQALDQCQVYTTKHGYSIKQAVNTAVAAKAVADDNDKTVAAIASEEAAELYGLKILEKNINESNKNSTRFAVLSRSPMPQDESNKYNHIMLMFTVKNEAGALAKAMNVLGAYGYNMSAVRSRPLKSLPWQYYFYIEASGDGTLGNEKKMLNALSATCDRLKLLGRVEWNEQ